MNYVPQGSPYSTQTKLLAAQNNVYPQQPQQGYNSPSWGYEKPVQTPVQTPVPAQQHYQQHYPQQHHPQQQPTHSVMPVGEPQQPQQQHIQQQQIHPQQIQQQQQPLLPQQTVHPQMPVYNHQEYPNMMASTHLQEKKEVDRQAYQPQPAVPQLPAQTHQFSGSIKSEPVATSSMNNSTQQNHR